MRQPWTISRDMFLEVAEVEALLDGVRERERRAEGKEALQAATDRLIVESLLFSGLRSSELCRLRVCDTPAGRDEPGFVVRGPGRESRTVFVPRSLASLVCRYVRQVRPHFLPEGVNPEDASRPLVYNDRRSPFERTGLYRRVVGVLTRAGLESRASVQLLRHTYGYLAYLRTGGNLLFVQRQLGHAHPMITSVYSQFVDESYEGLAERIGAQTRKPMRSNA